MTLDEEQARFHELFHQLSHYMTIAGEVKVTGVAGQVAGLFFADGHELKRGQRLMLMAVELDDNEAPIPDRAPEAKIDVAALVGEGPSREEMIELLNQWLETGALRRPYIAMITGSDADYQAWCRKERCVVCGQIDHHERGPCRGMVAGNQYAHVRRAGEAGTGFKPLYAGVPMCASCHSLQHQKGETAAYGAYLFSRDELSSMTQTEPSVETAKQWFHMKRLEHIERWVLETWPKVLGFGCWAKTPMLYLYGFCKENGVTYLLPDYLKQREGEKP